MTLPILLLALGLVLIVLELLFPTLGMLGVAAAAAIIAAIAVAFSNDRQSGVVLLIVTAVLVPAALMLGLRLLPRSPMGKWFVSRGYTFEDGAAVDTRDRSLVGKEGVAENLLRPAGTAHIDGRRVDVVTRGEPIEAGARVRVLDVEGNHVVVVPADDAGPKSSG
jgi:membrane-bound ClpP family serine protease